jgi:hypothetical protein
MPMPGIYNEGVSYTFVSASGGMPTMVGWNSTVVVRNDGTFARPVTGPPAGPAQFHCTYTSVDQQTCMAPCCPDQVTSPVMYFDKGGWTIWTTGSCAFQTLSAAQYIATITTIESYLSH